MGAPSFSVCRLKVPSVQPWRKLHLSTIVENPRYNQKPLQGLQPSRAPHSRTEGQTSGQLIQPEGLVGLGHLHPHGRACSTSNSSLFNMHCMYAMTVQCPMFWVLTGPAFCTASLLRAPGKHFFNNARTNSLTNLYLPLGNVHQHI